MAEVEQFRCLDDNYGYLLHCTVTGATAAIDTPEVGPILQACERKGWKLTHILNTHWHDDHAGGNDELKRTTGCTVIGPEKEVTKIPSIDQPVGGGAKVTLGELELDVLDVGGHTLGHIAFHIPSAGVAFVGDSLFALGCGRLFEGTPAQAWASLQRLAALPRSTTVYCAHEYTEANLCFALTVEPSNEALHARGKEIAALRAEGLPTVPTSIGLELETNPFLRPDSAGLRQTIGVDAAESDERTFAKVRSLKDNFRG